MQKGFKTSAGFFFLAFTVLASAKCDELKTSFSHAQPSCKSNTEPNSAHPS